MDLAGMRAQADELMAQFERMQSGVGELQQKLREVSATVTSPDGMVTATCGPRGQVVNVEFDPRIYRRPNSRELSRAVTDTIREAAAQAMAEVEELCKPFIPSAQFQAYMDHDLEGIFRELDSALPHDGDLPKDDKR